MCLYQTQKREHNDQIMAKNQTDKSRYPSKYSPQQWVTAAQYIIEIVCERRALQNQRELMVQFWKQPEWSQFFVSQLRMCHKLLKKYEAKAIIAALKDNRAKSVNSLFAPWLIPIIEGEQSKLRIQEVLAQNIPVERQSTTEKPRVAQPNKVLNKLKELDG